ncbi:MAG: PHP domain-containing protein [Clostridia bacterium]
MKYAVDLHIHTALSPCSDIEMTPNNIINMAKLKGLDIIAITDHNSAQNCHAVIECSKDSDVLVVPGMEIETKEEIHVVCLFPECKAAIEMQNFITPYLPNLKNIIEIFGEQLLFDENDNVVNKEDRMLITAVNLSINEVFKKVRELGGAAIPAHVDRNSYSIISNLGMIPNDLNVRYLELSKSCAAEDFLSDNPILKKYKIIKSSDAHYLGDILEKEGFIDIKSKNIKCLLDEFRNNRKAVKKFVKVIEDK